MLTFESLKKETDKYRYTLVLDCFRVALFFGVTETEEDFYYNLAKYNNPYLYCLSCVGRLVFLKDVLKPDDYNYLVGVWNASHGPTLQVK